MEQNIPVYSSMYGDNTMVGGLLGGNAEDNLVMYCTLKKQQLYKSSLSPALSTKQVRVIQRYTLYNEMFKSISKI